MINNHLNLKRYPGSNSTNEINRDLNPSVEVRSGVMIGSVTRFRPRSACERAFKCQGRQRGDSQRRASPVHRFRPDHIWLPPGRRQSAHVGGDGRDYKWYQAAVLQVHKTPNRQPASFLGASTDRQQRSFCQEEGECECPTKNTRP